MLGCRNGVDKVVLCLEADLILPRPAFWGSICVALCVRLLKRPDSCRAHLFARFASKEQPANPCLLALHASQRGKRSPAQLRAKTTVWDLHSATRVARALARCRPQRREMEGAGLSDVRFCPGMTKIPPKNRLPKGAGSATWDYAVYEVVSEGAGLSDASLVKIGVDRALLDAPFWQPARALSSCPCHPSGMSFFKPPRPRPSEMSTAQRCKQWAREEAWKATTWAKLLLLKFKGRQRSA